jgi:hypothetical protein
MRTWAHAKNNGRRASAHRSLLGAQPMADAHDQASGAHVLIVLAHLTMMAMSIASAACGEAAGHEQHVTPPMLEWRVENQTNQTVTDIQGSGRVDAGADASFSVTLTASDLHAIHRISMGGESSRNCGSDTIGQTTDALYADQNQTVDPASDAITTLSLTLDIGPDNACGTDLVWQGTSIHLFGEGSNKLGGTAGGELSIEISP